MCRVGTCDSATKRARHEDDTDVASANARQQSRAMSGEYHAGARVSRCGNAGQLNARPTSRRFAAHRLPHPLCTLRHNRMQATPPRRNGSTSAPSVISCRWCRSWWLLALTAIPASQVITTRTRHCRAAQLVQSYQTTRPAQHRRAPLH